jgi:hypothetical protein
LIWRISADSSGLPLLKRREDNGILKLDMSWGLRLDQLWGVTEFFSIKLFNLIGREQEIWFFPVFVLLITAEFRYQKSSFACLPSPALPAMLDENSLKWRGPNDPPRPRPRLRKPGLKTNSNWMHHGLIVASGIEELKHKTP